MYRAIVFAILCLGMASADHDVPIPERARDSNNTDINLDLPPTDSILAGPDTPVIAVSYRNGEIQFRDESDVMRRLGQRLDDLETNSSIHFDGFLFDGYFGSQKLKLKSLPKKLLNNNDSNSNDARNTNISFPNDEVLSKSDVSMPPLDSTSRLTPIVQNEQQVPATIYPEILMIADYTTYLQHNESIVNVVKYIVTLMNGVDMMFRDLTDPSIKLCITKIIIITDPAANRFITDAKTGADKVDAISALNNVENFFNQHQNLAPLDTYDIGFLMTTHSLRTGYCHVAGHSTLGGACRVRTPTELGHRYLMISDTGLYPVTTATRELGHLLNASDDGDENDCFGSDGFLMSNEKTAGVTNRWFFSNCSVESIRKFVRTNKASCLSNMPKTAAQSFLEYPLPGSLLTADEYCIANGFEESCAYGSCYNVYCSYDYMCVPKPTPLLGGPCGDEELQHCIRGECVSKFGGRRG